MNSNRYYEYQMTNLQDSVYYPHQNYVMAPPKYNNHLAHFAQKPDLSNGPLQKRTCTDVFFCLLFVLSIIALGSICMYSGHFGKPSEILGFYNDQGVMCSGTSFTYALIPGILNNNYATICVNSCPSKSGQTVSCSGKASCSSGQYTSTYQSISLGTYFCLPINTQFVQTINANYLTQVFADLKIAVYVFAGALAASFVLGLLYFIFLRLCASVIVWLSLVLFILGSALLGTYMYLYSVKIVLFNVPFSLNGYSEENIKIAAYVLWGIAGLSLLMVFCLFQRIKLSVAVVQATSKYISETCHIIFIPILMSIWLIACVALLAVGFIYTYSLGIITKDPTSPFVSVERTNVQNYLLYAEIFCGCWLIFFVANLDQFVLSSSATIWYFGNSSLEAVPHRPVMTSFHRAFRYHLGSIAFGSLVLTILFIVRVVVALLQQKNAAQGGNKAVQYMMKCVSCCLECFNQCMKFLNKGAYIQMAFKGTNYCTSAQEAFKLMLQNPVRLAITSGMGSAFSFIGKVTVAALVGIAAYFSLMKIEYFSQQISSPSIPTVICILIGFAVAEIYMSVFEISSAAIIQSFIIDEIESKTKGQSARCCPSDLRELLDTEAVKQQ